MAVVEVFGEYRVLDVLGHGAMGMVYRAHDPRLDRFVALKIVHPGRVAKDATKARARLVSEARALARVSHPNVLAVYDVGVQDELVFVALELVDGVDLAQWLRARSHPWTEVLDVFIEAAAGLAAVHAAGLVHRDVKPANILVEHAPRGRTFGRVLVADFGIARATATTVAVTLPGDAEWSGSEEDSVLTEAGLVVGTPAYMAPEQHVGLEVGHAADQYALCVALHEALYGKRPFGGDARSMLEAKTAPRDEPPQSDVPAWLWAIVRRGLSPRPRDRFPMMSDLHAALRAGPPRRRWRAVAALGAVAIVGSAIAMSLARDRPCRGVDAQVREVWNGRRRAEIEAAFAASERTYAAQTWKRASARVDAYARELVAMYRDACEATRVRHEQSEALFDRRIACLEGRRQRLAQSLALLAEGNEDAIDRAAGIVAALEPVAPCGDVEALESGVPPPMPDEREAVAEVQRMVADADAMQTAGRYEEAVAAALGAVERAREVDYEPALVEALTVASECLERQGRADESRVAVDEAISIGLQIGYDHVVVRAAVMRTWLAAEYERDVEEAQKWGALGQATLERIGAPPRHALQLANSLGAAYSNAERYDEALQSYEHALALAGDDPDLAPQAASVYSNIGNVWRLRGNLDRARESYERALAIFRAQLGDEHPTVARTQIRIAHALGEGGHHHEAIALLRAAIASLERAQALPDERATGLVELGFSLRWIGADEESTETYRQAVALYEQTDDDFGLAHALLAYGQLCLGLQVFDAAESQFQRVVALLEPIAPTHPTVGMALIGLGDVRHEQGRDEDAFSFYRRAYELATEDGAKTRVGARALVSMATRHRAAGRHDEAIAALAEQDAILAVAPDALADDRLSAAILRVHLMMDARRDTTTALEALEGLLADARATGGSRWLGEGRLLVARARLARSELEAGCAALAQAHEELALSSNPPELLAEARAAQTLCEAR